MTPLVLPTTLLLLQQLKSRGSKCMKQNGGLLSQRLSTVKKCFFFTAVRTTYETSQHGCQSLLSPIGSVCNSEANIQLEFLLVLPGLAFEQKNHLHSLNNLSNYFPGKLKLFFPLRHKEICLGEVWASCVSGNSVSWPQS